MSSQIFNLPTAAQLTAATRQTRARLNRENRFYNTANIANIANSVSIVKDSEPEEIEPDAETLQKAEDAGDICLICRSVLKIKVVPNRTCQCRQFCCLHCLRDHLKVANRRCLMGCGKPLNGSPPFTIADHAEMSELDQKYGQISCPRSCGWIGTRKGFQATHSAVCRSAIRQCKECDKIVVYSEHYIKCKMCQQSVAVCKYTETEGHSGCTAPRCACSQYEAEHQMVQCPGCLIKVKSCQTDTHCCSGSIYIGGSLLSLTDALKSKCPRCKLAGSGHQAELCLALIDLRLTATAPSR